MMVVIDPYVAELERRMEVCWDLARKFGLDPYPVNFEIVPASVMYEFGAYGLPGRFSHWTHGRSFHHQKTMYDYGLSKIYELVINSNPSYAFLLDGNSILQNTLVIAHVLAHCDFFKNNAYFASTNRQMIDGVSMNADRIRAYEFKHGKREVEEFLDAILSIQEHVDPHLTSVDGHHEHTDARPQVTPYDDIFAMESNPAGGPAVSTPTPVRRFPPEPQKDLLLFLAQHAPDLEEWQRDIMLIVRSEMLYFVPQMQTKIMNEGWASLWHARILREMDLTNEEYVEFATLHSSVLSPSKRNINPYHVGFKMFEDIERRWDNPSEEERDRLGRQPGKGTEKIFEVRQLESDVSFLRNYLTKELIDEMDMYIYQVEGDQLKVVETDWQKIRDLVVGSMTNFGNPYIVVEDADYRKARELYLKHVYEGQEIDIEYAEKTLKYVHYIWGRPIHLETVLGDKPILLTYDGEKNARRML
jgi:stage V sporulation protein R